jgi:hypothetical protein
MKLCSRYETEKSLDQFYQSSTSLDGREGRCKECRKAYGKTYFQANKSRYAAKRKERYQQDLPFRIAQVLRSRIARSIKSGSAVKDLGCSIQELKAYLEAHFQPGMSWDNYGLRGWHIDHTIPLDSFDLSDPKQLKQACHYTNLQPLWASANISKGNRLPR